MMPVSVSASGLRIPSSMYRSRIFSSASATDTPATYTGEISGRETVPSSRIGTGKPIDGGIVASSGKLTGGT